MDKQRTLARYQIRVLNALKDYLNNSDIENINQLIDWLINIYLDTTGLVVAQETKDTYKIYKVKE